MAIRFIETQSHLSNSLEIMLKTIVLDMDGYLKEKNIKLLLNKQNDLFYIIILIKQNKQKTYSYFNYLLDHLFLSSKGKSIIMINNH